MDIPQWRTNSTRYLYVTKYKIRHIHPHSRFAMHGMEIAAGQEYLLMHFYPIPFKS